MGEMTFDEAVTFMMEKANLTAPNARAEVGRYCSWPTQASSYLTGMLEILDIRTRFLAKRGASDIGALRTFHDANHGLDGSRIESLRSRRSRNSAELVGRLSAQCHLEFYPDLSRAGS